ncbi:MAG TPA: hypothetical protein VJ770_11015 [Stellaceae bacterium]|nr:hypothetical protein [Stellaceae bacterium]
MRLVLAAFAAGLLFTAGPASATPQFPVTGKTVPGITAHLEQVRQGCGLGWHRRMWRDRWGRWHWGRCVPNGYR